MAKPVMSELDPAYPPRLKPDPAVAPISSDPGARAGGLDRV